MARSSTSDLEQGRIDSGLTHGELFLRYFELGGMSTALQLEGFLYDALQPSAHDHDVIAHALNERFVEFGWKPSRPLSRRRARRSTNRMTMATRLPSMAQIDHRSPSRRYRYTVRRRILTHHANVVFAVGRL